MLQALLAVARRVFADSNVDDETIFAPDGQSFSVVLPSGTGTIYANHGVFFNFAEVDPLTRRMILEIAKAGDMYILADGLTVRTNSAQPPRPTWVRDEDEVYLCRSPEELETALENWLKPYRGFRDSVLPSTANQSQAERTLINLEGRTSVVDALGDERTCAPGLGSEAPGRFVYIEARLEETATEHQKKLYKYIRDHYKSGRHSSASAGLLTAEFWRLTAPSGPSFYAYGYSGDNRVWLETIQAFAARDGRAVGSIENGDTFVQEDGCRFPLNECRIVKMKA
jgi:hypothetical protein